MRNSNVCLTGLNIQGYSEYASAKSDVGIGILDNEAHKPLTRSFYAKNSVYGGLGEGSKERRLTSLRYANLAQFTTKYWHVGGDTLTFKRSHPHD